MLDKGEEHQSGKQKRSISVSFNVSGNAIDVGKKVSIFGLEAFKETFVDASYMLGREFGISMKMNVQSQISYSHKYLLDLHVSEVEQGRAGGIVAYE